MGGIGEGGSGTHVSQAQVSRGAVWYFVGLSLWMFFEGIGEGGSVACASDANFDNGLTICVFQRFGMLVGGDRGGWEQHMRVRCSLRRRPDFYIRR